MDIYYFNELGTYDEYNPSFYLDRKNAKDIIYWIAKKPYSVDIDYIYNKVDLGKSEIDIIIKGLLNINAIIESSNKYKVNFPVFFEKDIKNIIKLIDSDIRTITNKVSKFVSGLTYNKDTLYHLICNDVFDNYAIDYLSNRNLITNNKINAGNRNYLIIGYEKNGYMSNYSSKLLCSNNKYICNSIVFNTFGDADGNRDDFFRYFRLKQMNIIKSNEIHEYFIKQKDEDEFKKKLEDTVLGNGKDALVLLEGLGYFKDGKINVPLINKKEYLIIGNHLMDQILDDIIIIFNKVKYVLITPNINNIDYKDTSNELWHIIFGLINEELVNRNIVSYPKHYKEQGRYLRCIYIEKE